MCAVICVVFLLVLPLAVYFDVVNETAIEYSIRLRHEVSYFDSWLTAVASSLNQGVGARVQPK